MPNLTTLQCLTLADTESSPLPHASVAATNASLAGTVAFSAMFIGALLVAYWYRRRLLAAPKTDAGKAGESAALAKDLYELTERLAVELDRKATRLEALIASADERIRQIERMELEAPRLATSKAPDPRLIEPRHRVRHESSGDSGHQEVYELADAGMTPVDIARKLDRHTGQIELILNLRRGTVAL